MLRTTTICKVLIANLITIHKGLSAMLYLRTRKCSYISVVISVVRVCHHISEKIYKTLAKFITCDT